MKPLSITFLGTCSGGGPLISRACSATALNFDSASWLIDCAEGTQTQILRTGNMRIGRVDKVFVTHMHADHVMGLIPLLRSAMYNVSAYSQLRMQLYGPPGLRSFIRFNLKMTEVALNGRYAVHELLQKGDTPSAPCTPEEMHDNEAPGMDIEAGEDGLWRDVVAQDDWSVDVGPIAHRTRCLGYVFREHHSSTIGAEAYIPHLDRNAEGLHAQEIRFPRALLKNILRDRKTLALPDGTILEPPPLDIPGRKIVILGDTNDASAVEPIAMDASVLVHESTNAYMPKEITDKVKGLGTSKGTVDTVRKKAIGRGHSTADMAGEFAKKIRTKRLYLNHFSTKFCPGGYSPPSPTKAGSPSRRQHSAATRTRQGEAKLVMDEIERQASEAWGMGHAVAAMDLMTVDIPPHEAVAQAVPQTVSVIVGVVPLVLGITTT